MELREVVFNLTNGGRIKLSDHVVDTFLQYRQVDISASESGGVLLGRFIKESKDIIIDKITTPLKGDMQTKFSFKRLSPLHQLVVYQEWAKSKGTCNYLGEWHTHPEGFPTPSKIDIRDWKRKIKGDVFSSRYLYFIIVGTFSIEIWEADRRTLGIIKLKQVVNK